MINLFHDAKGRNIYILVTINKTVNRVEQVRMVLAVAYQEQEKHEFQGKNIRAHGPCASPHEDILLPVITQRSEVLFYE